MDATLGDDEHLPDTPSLLGAELPPENRTAQLVDVDGVIVARSSTPIDDDIMFGIIDELRSERM